jgi:hypothetical protein
MPAPVDGPGGDRQGRRMASRAMRRRQVVAGVLAASAAYVGWWALLVPRSFYDSFPGLGQHWVAQPGPYNEHLVRDVGGLYLGLMIISIWTVLRPARDVARVVGAAWLIFSIPHLIFHLSHLDGLSTAAQVGEIGSLAGTVLLAGVLLLG